MPLEFRFSIHPEAAKAGAHIPDKKHLDDAGWDVYPVQLDAPWPQFPVTLQPGEALKIPTGLTFVAPRGWFPEVVAKTGLALRGIVPAAVVYDWGYRPDPDAVEGSVFSIRNVSDKAVVIEGHKAFAQIILRPLCVCTTVQVEHGQIDHRTERGGKRYGMADGEADPI